MEQRSPSLAFDAKLACTKCKKPFALYEWDRAYKLHRMEGTEVVYLDLQHMECYAEPKVTKMTDVDGSLLT